jgi:hypothetical protein
MTPLSLIWLLAGALALAAAALHGRIPLRRPLPTLALAMGTFSIHWAAPVSQMADSTYSLLLSETILREQSFQLDRHFKPPLHPWLYPGLLPSGLPYQLVEVGDELHLSYAPGVAVLSIPAVGVMNLFGLHTINADRNYNFAGEKTMQRILAALLVAMLVCIIHHTALTALPHVPALLIALAAGFGTSLLSNASRAVWADTWASLLIGVVILHFFRVARTKRPLSPLILATLIAWSVFAKHTGVIPVLTITAYVALRHPRSLPVYLGVGLLWAAVLEWYSLFYLRAPVPFYYVMEDSPTSLFEALSEEIRPATILTGLAGVLISPSRGLLLYTPTPLFVAWLTVRHWRSIAPRGLALLAVATIALQILITAAWPIWHGGHAYGPRLFTTLIPWFALLAVLGVEALLKGGASSKPRIQCAAAGLLIALSVFIHARGAFVQATWAWNDRPGPEQFQRALWDWRDMQMLAGWTSLAPPLEFPALPLGERFDAGAPEVYPHLMQGWGNPWFGTRWTVAKKVGLAFGLDEIRDMELQLTVRPFLAGGRIAEQRVRVFLNGTLIADTALDEPLEHDLRLPLSSEILQPENILEFHLPNARTPASLGFGPWEAERALLVSEIELLQ